MLWLLLILIFSICSHPISSSTLKIEISTIMNASLPLKQRQRKPLSMSCFYFWGEPCSNRCAKVLSKYISFESLARGTERKGWTIYLSNITFYETSSHTHEHIYKLNKLELIKWCRDVLLNFPWDPTWNSHYIY